MALNFPDSPSNGDVAHGFTYNSAKGVWEANRDAVVSDTAPSNPRNGEFWFDSSTAKLYVRYEDGSSNQWVTVTGATGADGAPGSATVYANTSVLPSSGNSVGDLGFATLTKSLHVWDGSEWDRINAGGDENPRLTTIPSSTHSLNNDGTNTAITIAATDPEGFPITYSYDTNPANPNQITNVVENNGVFTLVPSTNTAHAGTFVLRLKASDGVHITSTPITVELNFIPNNSLNYGTSSNNYWLEYNHNSAFSPGTNSWTHEAWIYPTGSMSDAGIYSTGPHGSKWSSLHMTSQTNIKYVIANGSGTQWNYTASNAVNANQWNHVALVRRFGTDIKLYVNGSAVHTNTSNPSVTMGSMDGAVFKLGKERFLNSGGAFHGLISNYRYVNGTAVYTANFTPPTEPLTNIANTVILHYGVTNSGTTGSVGNPTNYNVTESTSNPFT